MLYEKLQSINKFIVILRLKFKKDLYNHIFIYFFFIPLFFRLSQIRRVNFFFFIYFNVHQNHINTAQNIIVGVPNRFEAYEKQIICAKIENVRVSVCIFPHRQLTF